jgi:pyruvate dehydrogenase E2 component (dihydrolipoamide acetyltransferase)
VIEVKMPRLSDTMEEGAISTWHKHPGDSVAVGDVLVEIETDKAVMEYEAYQAGTLSKILIDEGQIAEIGATIALLDDGSVPAQGGDPLEPPRLVPAEGGAPAAAALTAETPAAHAPAPASQAGAPQADNSKKLDGVNGDTRLIASPLVRKLARENHLDLSHVRGTGPGGRIIRADIAGLLGVSGSAATAQPPAPASAPAPVPVAASAPAMPAPATHVPPAPGVPSALPAPSALSAPSAPAAEGGSVAPGAGVVSDNGDIRGSRSVPMSQVRRVIAKRLAASAREIPHYYVTAAADAEELMTLRRTLNAQLTAAGRAKISVNDLLIRAVALALREHPEVNVSYAGEASTTMLIHDRVNIGVAVAAESGLIVPVIADADAKTVTQIGAEAKKLVALAAERKLTQAQTSGGTFTISNLGMYGVEDFTAIINPPEAAILAVGATTREPAVVGDEIVPRYKMRYTLSSDHRVIDGALAAQFLKALTRLIENPWLIIA